MQGVDIHDLKELTNQSKILWTEHIALRLMQRDIKRADVLECIQTGEIIEQYPTDKPFPSCLILGKSVLGVDIHVVCGLDKDMICYIITAYYPSLEKWESDLKTRKEGN